MNKFDPIRLEKAIKNLNHDATVVLAECNQYFVEKPKTEKVDLDVDRVLKHVKCNNDCCNSPFRV
jgi:hypothetical protein